MKYSRKKEMDDKINYFMDEIQKVYDEIVKKSGTADHEVSACPINQFHQFIGDLVYQIIHTHIAHMISSTNMTKKYAKDWVKAICNATIYCINKNVDH